MNKMALFKTIGEALARTGQHNGQATVFIKNLVNEWYPFNESRRDWAVSNLEMFYTQERERMEIMRKLQSTTEAPDVLADIRRRNLKSKLRS